MQEAVHPIWGLRQRPLVFVDDLDRPCLTLDDLHHFERVLRLERGQLITIGDGAGRWREAQYGPRPTPTGEIGHLVGPEPPITVAFVPVKGQGPDWYVQKLTELGVDEIVPVISARSVVRWDPVRAARQRARMIRAAREACLQCRRLTLPRIGPLTRLEALVGERQDRGQTVVLADPDGDAMSPTHTMIVVGPEGGFTTDELSLAPAVALPGHILRAETAAVAAATIACGFRAQMVAPPSR